MSDFPHDRWSREVFARPAAARALLGAFLPEAVRRLVDLEELTLESGTFVDEALGERRADLLFRVGSRLRIYVLFEHKSAPDPWLPVQLLGYVARIHERARVEEGCLRPVIPLVLHTGSRPWTSPLGVTDLLDLEPRELDACGDLVGRQGYVLVDLSTTPDAVLRGLAVEGAYAALALLVMKHVRAPDFRRRFAGWADLVRALAGKSDGRRSIAALFCYVGSVRDAADAHGVIQDAVRDIPR